MKKIIFDENKCKGCGLCVEVCPKKILKLDLSKINVKGYNPLTCIDEDKCISCAFCATVCPDLVIEVFRT